jgi:hypothetical protein
MNYTCIIGFGALLFAVGCATTNLPSGATKVGGGLMIHWAAPKDGTAILVETRTGKTVATKSVSEGDEFEFDVTSSDCSQTLEAIFPVMPTNAQFVLFFVPSPKSD